MFKNLIFEIAQEFFTHVKNRNNLICADIHNMDRVRTLSRRFSERISRTYSESLHPYLYDIHVLLELASVFEFQAAEPHIAIA